MVPTLSYTERNKHERWFLKEVAREERKLGKLGILAFRTLALPPRGHLSQIYGGVNSVVPVLIKMERDEQ